MGTLNKYKQYEGKVIEFLGDESMKRRFGIITSIVYDTVGDVMYCTPTRSYSAIVLWDEDEFVAIENGKSIICFDTGVSTYPIASIDNAHRFKIHF
jgi:hypothetical protein